ncbi:nitroreductase/quinone reductase family protein [Parafrankia sp. CH37]|nr:nitroreductase/quinone reductase family protein [Parafrankia sp. CH37]
MAPPGAMTDCNLLAHPLVEVREGAITRTLHAREVSGAAKTELWKTADTAWPHFPEHCARTDREPPMFLLGSR